MMVSTPQAPASVGLRSEGRLRAAARRALVRVTQSPRTAPAAHYLFNGLGAESRRNCCPALIRAAAETGYLGWPLRLARLVRGRDIVDVGCGRSLHAVGFVLIGARSYTGIDPVLRLDKDSIKNLRTRRREPCGWTPRRIMQRLPRVRYIAGTFEDVAPGETFDVAVLHNVTEHLMRIDDVFEGIRRRLRAGGLLVFNHHNFYCWNGHHQKPYTVAEIDTDDAEQRKYLDWAHLSYQAQPEEYLARGLNRIRLDALRSLVERHFIIQQWDELLSDMARGGGRLTDAIRHRHPQYTDRELNVHNVFCIAARRAAPQREGEPAMRGTWAAVGLSALALAMMIPGCSSPPTSAAIEAGESPVISLLGHALPPAKLATDRRAALEADLAAALTDHRADPENEEAMIWVGRRLAYLGRYREAIRWFSDALQAHPRSFRLLRHRGHRLITVRDFDRAVADLSRAAELVRGLPDEVEPDGQPNERNIPRSTTQTNILYHLGLAHYLRGDFETALQAYEPCLARCTNDDMRVATQHWMYMTLRRLGREAEAAALLNGVHAKMDIIENHAYHRLLLMDRGELRPDEVLDASSGTAIDDATTAYGVAMWRWFNGERDAARALLERIVTGEAWAAFGFIAAEADLARQRGGHSAAGRPPRG